MTDDTPAQARLSIAEAREVERNVLRMPDGRDVDLADQKAVEAATDEIAEDFLGDGDDAERAARQAKKLAEDRHNAHIETLRRLQEFGSGILFPTHLRPHLVCAKAKKGDRLYAEHGVTFRRHGADCLVEAGNRIAFVSILLENEGEDSPRLAVVPREAMEIVAAAEDELARIWFHDVKVYVLVDQAVHEFFLLQPDLPIGQNLRDTDARQRSLAGPQLNAAELAKVQKALACDSLAMRWHSRGVVSLYPDGIEKSPHRGYLATYSSSEEPTA